jgi:hypothetical protein
MPFASCVSALHLPHLQPGFLQAHLAWSVQQVQALPLSHAQAASLAQLHLSPQEQVLPATHSHLALQAQPCFSPSHVQHPANTAASATAAIIINFFIFDSFLWEYLSGNYRTLLDFVRLRLPTLRVAALEATYLAWVDATALGFDSTALAARLEYEAKVKFSQGAIYGEPHGSAFLRINLACPRITLMDALERFAKWTETRSGRFPEHGDRYFTKGLFAT